MTPHPTPIAGADGEDIVTWLRQTWPTLSEAGPVTRAQRELAHEAADTIIHLRAEVTALKAKLAEAVEGLTCAFSAADALLAPICAEAGRVLMEMPEENMTEHLPVLPAKLFAALYEATHPDILTSLSEQERG